MELSYFNYSHLLASNAWDRYWFLKRWWSFYSGDRFWAPPYYPHLRRALDPGHSAYLSACQPLMAHSTAVGNRRVGGQEEGWLPADPGMLFSQGAGERLMAAAIALTPSNRPPGTAYLALPHLANHPETLERMLHFFSELLSERGCQRLIGPTGLSPALGSGALLEPWNHINPLHTAYNPPYLPEVLDQVMRPLAEMELYALQILSSQEPAVSLAEPLVPFPPGRLAHDLLPLLAASLDDPQLFPAPDQDEAAFLLDWLKVWPVQGWLAQRAGQPVGFLLIGPDLAPHLQRTAGGKPLWGRLWLHFIHHKPASNGRIFLAGVSPAWRRRGVGAQLFAQALGLARQSGWKQLTCGPLISGGSSANWLKSRGGECVARYRLYEWSW